MNFTEQDIKDIERFVEIKNKGYFCNANQLQVVYNRVFDRNLPATTCSSCMRRRIQELEDAMNRYKREQENLKIDAAKAVLSILEDQEQETEKIEQNEEENAIESTTPIATKPKKTRKGSKQSNG